MNLINIFYKRSCSLFNDGQILNETWNSSFKLQCKHFRISPTFLLLLLLKTFPAAKYNMLPVCERCVHFNYYAHNFKMYNVVGTHADNTTHIYKHIHKYYATHQSFPYITLWMASHTVERSRTYVYYINKTKNYLVHFFFLGSKVYHTITTMPLYTLCSSFHNWKNTNIKVRF